MPLEKKEIEESKKREAEIHNRILVFLTSKEGFYFNAKEIAAEFNIFSANAKRHLQQLYMNSPIYYQENKYKSVDMYIDEKGENFYGII